MFSKPMKVHAIRSDSPTTVAVDLLEPPVEGQPMMGRVISIPGLTPQQASAFEVHQEVEVSVTPTN